MSTSTQPRIVVFTSTSCSWCTRIKQYLKQNGFKFREINVEKDRDAAKELERKNIRGVPVILINNRPVVGFDKPLIDRLLGIKSG